MKRDFTAIFKKDGKWFVGWVEEVPGANTQGRTMKEARENLKEALALIIETNRTLAQKDLVGSAYKREPLSITLS